MSKSEGEALLLDIIEHPDDDTPRLVYADWLDEHGDPNRAEFIRVQCRLAALPAGSSEATKLARREKTLLKEHGAPCGAKPISAWLGSCAEASSST